MPVSALAVNARQSWQSGRSVTSWMFAFDGDALMLVSWLARMSNAVLSTPVLLVPVLSVMCPSSAESFEPQRGLTMM